MSKAKKHSLMGIFFSAFLILLGFFIILLPFINIEINYPIIEKEIKVQSVEYYHVYKSVPYYRLITESNEKFRINPGFCLKEFDEEVINKTAYIKYYKTYIFGIKRIQELSVNTKTYVSPDYFKSGSKVIPIVLGSISFLMGWGGISLEWYRIKNEQRKALNRRKRLEKKYGNNAGLKEQNNDNNQ